MSVDSIDRLMTEVICKARAARGLSPKALDPASLTGPHRYEAKLLGEELGAETLSDLTVMVLRRLERQAPGTLERLSQLSRRKRQLVSKTPEALYPGRPDLSVYARQVVKGWWVGTNYGRRDVRSILMIACSVAELNYGWDMLVRVCRADANGGWPKKETSCWPSRHVRSEDHPPAAPARTRSPSGSPILRFHAAGWTEMAWHLYQWGDTVEVIAPEESRRMVEGYRRGNFYPVLP